MKICTYTKIDDKNNCTKYAVVSYLDNIYNVSYSPDRIRAIAETKILTASHGFKRVSAKGKKWYRLDYYPNAHGHFLGFFESLDDAKAQIGQRVQRVGLEPNAEYYEVNQFVCFHSDNPKQAWENGQILKSLFFVPK